MYLLNLSLFSFVLSPRFVLDLKVITAKKNNENQSVNVAVNSRFPLWSFEESSLVRFYYVVGFVSVLSIEELFHSHGETVDNWLL